MDKIKITKEYEKPKRRYGIKIIAKGICKIKAYNYDRKVVIDAQDKVHFIHHLVWRKYATLDEIKKYEAGSYHIHHKDGDFLNNTSSNLKLLKAREHKRIHAKEAGDRGRIILTEYNKSTTHRERIKALHQDGHYSAYTWAQTYNGSEKHLNDIQKFWKDSSKEKAREAIRDTFRKYNKSEHHSRVVSERNKKLWKDPVYRKKMLKVLRDQDGEKISKRVTEDWKREGEGERRVLARIISTVINSLKDKKSFNSVRARNVPILSNVKKKWRFKKLIRMIQKKKPLGKIYRQCFRGEEKNGIGGKILSIRTSRSMTQKDLADKINVSTVCVSNLENGKTKPSKSTRIKLDNWMKERMK